MSTPNYEAELDHARMMVVYAIDSLGLTAVVETLPEELYSPEAAERIANLIQHFGPRLPAEVEENYKKKGTTQ